MKLIDIVAAVPIRFAYRMAFLTNFYREPLLRQMEKTHGIIRPEWTVLICLAFRDGLNPRDICEITEQPRNTISRATAALVAKGMITRTHSPVRGSVTHRRSSGSSVQKRSCTSRTPVADSARPSRLPASIHSCTAMCARASSCRFRFVGSAL